MSKYGEPEIYSRFIRQDWLRENNSRVHSKAFAPLFNQGKQRQELSCYETQFLSQQKIQEIIDANKIQPNGKNPFGHSSIEEASFPYQYLRIDYNYDCERHIDIIGWENCELSFKEITLLLSELASLIIVLY